MTTTKTKATTRTVTKRVETVSEDLPSNPFSFEVLNLVSKQRSNAKKVELLQRYDHPSLKTIFIWNFDETVISILPQGEVPYAATSEQNSFSGTLSEKITDAVDKMSELGSNSLGSQDQGRSSIRKEYLKDKKLETKYKITKQNISEAYPDIQWGNRG